MNPIFRPDRIALLLSLAGVLAVPPALAADNAQPYTHKAATGAPARSSAARCATPPVTSSARSMT
jgi:hypothetical protein